MNLTIKRMRILLTNKSLRHSLENYVLVLMRSKLKWYNFKLLKLIEKEMERREMKNE